MLFPDAGQEIGHMYSVKLCKQRLKQVYRRSGSIGEFTDKARIEREWVDMLRVCRQVVYLC